MLWDQNAPKLEQVAGELDARAAPVDIAQPHLVQEAMERAVEHLRALDGVVHSAGILRAGLFDAVDMDAHCRTVTVNLLGTVAVAYAAIPHLKVSRGSLVMMASTASFYGPPEYASYGATKAGVLNFAQALRVELYQFCERTACKVLRL